MTGIVKTLTVMSLELEVQKFPKKTALKDKFQCTLRPLRKDDEKKFHDFFLAVPEQERMFERACGIAGEPPRFF